MAENRVIPFQRPRRIKNKKRPGRKARVCAGTLLCFPVEGCSLADRWRRVAGRG
jgi:hypothetical protein